ncbi:MAG: stage IV sporulation protein A [Clostridiales bacterium]|jgi:stage IV sporulation protein A|nr:stage IV sporulation protein A [Clostridiales bacterium]
MQDYDVYRDIAERTGGDIYIGVVGPVRTGKSTFIKRFMDLLVIPNIDNAHNRERARDELPQSGTGKAIMTTEPKFVPNEAAEIKLNDTTNAKVRLIDCVGYIVPSASGYLDEDEPRLINTPWFEDKIPFAEAAEYGTKKVINEHSTIGVVVTTDGSVTDIPRADYIDAEERVVSELQAINKPFVVLINTSRPYAAETDTLKAELSEKYAVPAIAVNAAQLKPEDITQILEGVLYEFPVREIRINTPKWIETLGMDHWLKSSIVACVKEIAKCVGKLRGIKDAAESLEASEHIKKAFLDRIDLGTGSALIEASVADDLFYKVLSETTGMDIGGEYQLISTIKVLAEAKREHDKVKAALEDVNRKGYGIVTPVMEEMRLDAPALVRHGSKYGVRLKASAPAIHMIRADIETEISPIVGTEKQSQELVDNLTREMEGDPEKIWQLNMFGKSMSEMVREGIQGKLYRMPEDSQMKLQEAIQKIINEGSRGLICIIL